MALLEGVAFDQGLTMAREGGVVLAESELTAYTGLWKQDH